MLSNHSVERRQTIRHVEKQMKNRLMELEDQSSLSGLSLMMVACDNLIASSHDAAKIMAALFLCALSSRFVPEILEVR